MADYDVIFTYSGTSYYYMLAADEKGKKVWNVRQLYRPPPSLLKHKIDMTLLAAPKMRDGSTDNKTTTAKTLSQLKSDLSTLLAGNTITLTGYDNETYYVTFDPDATNIKSMLDESGRITHYEIDVSCWDIYQT